MAEDLGFLKLKFALFSSFLAFSAFPDSTTEAGSLACNEECQNRKLNLDVQRIAQVRNDIASNSILFQNICSSARNNFQPCVDMQDENEKKLKKKVHNCFENGLGAFKKVDDALTAKQREALDPEYKNALLKFLGCYLGAYLSDAEEKKLCMSQFIDRINSNFCPSM